MTIRNGILGIEATSAFIITFTVLLLKFMMEMIGAFFSSNCSQIFDIQFNDIWL